MRSFLEVLGRAFYFLISDFVRKEFQVRRLNAIPERRWTAGIGPLAAARHRLRVLRTAVLPILFVRHSDTTAMLPKFDPEGPEA